MAMIITWLIVYWLIGIVVLIKDWFRYSDELTLSTIVLAAGFCWTVWPMIWIGWYVPRIVLYRKPSRSDITKQVNNLDEAWQAFKRDK